MRSEKIFGSKFAAEVTLPDPAEDVFARGAAAKLAAGSVLGVPHQWVVIIALLFVLVSLILAAGVVASSQDTSANSESSQVIQFLNQTIDWYRQVATQQQIAAEPNDLTVANDNRQMGDQIVRLAFDFARARADAIAKRNNSAGNQNAGAGSSQDSALLQLETKLDAQIQQTQVELESVRQKKETASGKKRQELQSQMAELQAELDLAKARRDAIHSMVEFAGEARGVGSGVTGLRAQIQALADSLPGVLTAPSNSSEAAFSSKAQAHPATVASVSATTEVSGIWDLSAELFALSQEIRKVDDAIQKTSDLARRSEEIRVPLANRLRQLASQGDELAQAADTASNTQLGQERQQLDSLAAQFKEGSAGAIPLSKQGILLELYQRNLAQRKGELRSLRTAELKGLLVRLTFLALVLSIVAAAGELWRRAVYRYVQEPRRRYQFLLLRKFALWFLIAVIVAFSFASKLGSVVTFAGLITAGVAVALQSVILSIVGYFFLIGKYGIRLGDRVQVGGVTGQVIDIGLVRLHLMELAGGDGDYLSTGRVVAFSNSIVFQPTAGLFKQIPGTNFLWHEITLELSPDADYSSVKQRLLGVVESVLADYRDDMDRQYRAMQTSFVSPPASEFHPKAQIRFTPAAVEVVVRYPVDRQKAAEIDERVTRELLEELDREPKLHLASSGTPGIMVRTALATA